MAVFIAWHVVWDLTGLRSPSPSDHQGAARTVMQLYSAILLLMVAVGALVPLALAQSWGRRIPRWMLLSAAWIGCALLSARGLMGIADELVRFTGILPLGFSGMTIAQVLGSVDWSAWALIASCATDWIFVVGGLLFGRAAIAQQRLSGCR